MHINWLKNQIFVHGCMLRSHARNGNECQAPCHRHSAANIEILGFLNSSKSKTRLKFMKLGMLSWSGINMPWYKFCPFWGRFGYMLLTKRSFSQQAWWFSVGKHPTFGDETISIASYCFQFFFSCQHRPIGVLCEFFVIFRGLFGYFYALIEFSMHLCA